MLILLLCFANTDAIAASDSAPTFKTYFQTTLLEPRDKTPVYKDALEELYKDQRYKLIWRFSGFNKNADRIERVINDLAFENGLNPDDYDFGAIKKIENPYEREWRMTNAVMHYIHDVRTGRVDPAAVDGMTFLRPQYLNLSENARRAIKSRKVEAFLQNLEPQHHEYKILKKRLIQYRQIATNGGWPTIKINRKKILYPGDSHPAIPLVRERLNDANKEFDGALPDDIWIDEAQLATEKLTDHIAHSGTLELTPEHIEQNNIYDGALAKRVAEFQYFNGKKADGVLGPNTIRTLNVSVERRIDQIILAMERWRWQPDSFGEKHVRINIASFQVRGIRDGRDEIIMPIIVGEIEHQTPVFSSVIKNVKLHPDWTAPDSIAGRYVIPKIQNNPDVVNRLGYQVQSKSTGEIIPWDTINIAELHNIDLRQYQFRQKPGYANALGRARISIENPYAIFMHGTPSNRLFSHDDRAFSSGCVRLQDPFKMAYFLLKDQGVSEKYLRSKYEIKRGVSPKTQYIALKNDVPVYLMYNTAWVDQDGNLHFADDLYGRDGTLLKALVRDS